MGGQHGVENTVKVLDLLIEGGNIAEDIIKDNGSAFQKMAHLLQLTDELAGLSTFNASDFKLEVGELDSEDLSTLYERFKTKFDLADDHVEGLVEEGLGMVKEGYAFTKKIIDFANKVKGSKVS